jgi:hypothetical protein
MPDVWVSVIEIAARGIEAVAFFRHRRADDRDARIAHRGEQRLRILRRDMHAAQGADHLQRFALVLT